MVMEPESAGGHLDREGGVTPEPLDDLPDSEKYAKRQKELVGVAVNVHLSQKKTLYQAPRHPHANGASNRESQKFPVQATKE